jgi:hypothetical protein
MLVFARGIAARPAVAPYHRSFPNAKLAEDRVENLFHIDNANHFADCSQCFMKVNCRVFRRQSLGLHRRCSIA